MENKTEITKEDIEIFKSVVEDQNQEKPTVDSKGNFAHKEFAKKFSPNELTEDRIMELVNLQFPLFTKTDNVTKEERTQRSKSRNKLKDALKDRAKQASQEKPRVEVQVKEEKIEDVKEGIDRAGLIDGILRLQSAFPSENDYSQEDLEGFKDEDLQGYFAHLQNRCASTIQNSGGEALFTMLLLGAKVAESTGPSYGYDFSGITNKHMEQKELLVEIMTEVLEEHPELKKFVTPTMRLFMTVGGIYASTLYENSIKKK